MQVFLIMMAVFSRLLPGRASDMALKLMTTPRLPRLPADNTFPPPDKEIPVGARARLQVWSGGPRRVLLVHGWSGHWSQFQAVMAQLGRDDYSFFALQMPGHGLEPDGRSHVGEFIATVRMALDRLGEPADLLVGHSMGAAAAAFVLSERADIGRTILIAPPTDFREVVGRMASWLRFGPRARRQLLDKMARRVGLGYDALDIAHRGEMISSKVLLVHDAGDREVPFTDSLRLYQAIPSATLHQTTGKGHRRVLSDQVVLETVAGFASEGVLSPGAMEESPLRAPA